MKLKLPYWLFCLLFPLNAFTQVALPEGFAMELLFGGLNPVAMTVDHHGRTWLAEKNGSVLIVEEDGSLLPDPFITIQVDDFNERGLMGIALHPDFDNFPFVYLYYTVTGQNHNRVSRFRANGDLAIPGSEEILFDFDQLEGAIHNGGAMIFDQNQYLYIATGDGADPLKAQDFNSLLGKILRINADGSIPSDNPFYDTLEGNYRAIWALGNRNPFTMDYDPETGKIFTCDVGLGDFEEVNEIGPALNYGWPIVEGYATQGSLPVNYRNPFYAYSHDEGCAIIGGTFFPANVGNFPEEYRNAFLFADYCMGFVHLIDKESGALRGVFAEGLERPLAFKFNEFTGDLLFLSRKGLGGGSQQDNTSTNDGALWRIFYTGSGAPVISADPQDLLVPVGEAATFKIQALGSDTIQYQWQVNGNDIPGSNSTEYQLDSTTLNQNGDTFRCIVSNEEGTDTSEVAILAVTSNQRPLVQIISPTDSSQFRAGDILSFSGFATDPEDGPIPDSMLCWKVDLHHNDHTHPALNLTCGTGTGQYATPTITETDTNVWYRVYLTAEDSEGLQKVTYVHVLPKTTRIHLQGPAGAKVNVDGKIRTLPYSFSSLIGLQRVLEIQEKQKISDSIYIFQSWGNGHITTNQTFYTPENGLSLNLKFTVHPLGKGKGLFGQYYTNGIGFADQQELAIQRIDSTINFNWGDNSPFDDDENNDFFTIRWTGEIEPIFSENLNFHLTSDDGARLWVNDQLIIDRWRTQGPTEITGNIFLEANKKYPIKLEYFEMRGGAQVNLKWSSFHLSKEIIPFSQLYPPPVSIGQGQINGTVWIDINCNKQFEDYEEYLMGAGVFLLDYATDSLIAYTQVEENGRFNFHSLPAGEYYLEIVPGGQQTDLLPSEEFSFGAAQFITLDSFGLYTEDIAFIPKTSSCVSHLQYLNVYPNPGKDWIELSTMVNLDTKIQLFITDIHGKEIHQEELNFPLGFNTKSIDLRPFPPGVFLVNLTDGFNLISEKIIKLP